MVGIWLGFAILPWGALVALGILDLVDPVPGDDKRVPQLTAVLGILGVTFSIVAAIASLEAGRLAFYATRSELPRLAMPPWCFFGPRELVYSEVRRWGVAAVRPDDEPLVVLVFEVGSGNHPRIEKLPIMNYADPKVILAEFLNRLPPPSRVKVEPNFGRVTFTE
jgi:hypothetical protein